MFSRRNGDSGTSLHVYEVSLKKKKHIAELTLNGMTIN